MKIITLESGSIIKIGKNAAENFNIIDSANPNDLWFHLKNLPSCHVILETNANGINYSDIRQAAEQCLANTKYREMNSVYVEYLPVNDVVKTNVPGKVILKHKPLYIIVRHGHAGSLHSH